ncbi:efflux RND transporter periplasmic adaptor subunit, partial [Acidobacteriota bacterium]
MSEKKNSNGNKKKIFLIIGFIVVLAVIFFFNFQAQREKSVKVKVEKVEREDLTSIISASGEVKPKKSVNISAQIPGRIMKIGVVEGERVMAGDFLLKLDATQYQANADRDQAIISTYNAELIKARARLQKDERFYQRQKQLHDEELISGEDLETAKANMDISNATQEAILYQIKQAEASLQSTLDNLKKTTYNSPIDGIITSLRIEEGEIALVGTMNNPGTVLLAIADLSIMEVEVEVDETDVVAV